MICHLRDSNPWPREHKTTQSRYSRMSMNSVGSNPTWDLKKIISKWLYIIAGVTYFHSCLLNTKKKPKQNNNKYIWFISKMIKPRHHWLLLECLSVTRCSIYKVHTIRHFKKTQNILLGICCFNKSLRTYIVKTNPVYIRL